MKYKIRKPDNSNEGPNWVCSRMDRFDGMFIEGSDIEEYRYNSEWVIIKKLDDEYEWLFNKAWLQPLTKFKLVSITDVKRGRKKET